MPTLARLYGIVIRMYLKNKEHNPPHIHAIVNEDTASIDIQSLKVIEGELNEKDLSLVKGWIKSNKDVLLEIWNTNDFSKIKDLK
ncbi:MAG: DUF4160 domain-containing protein [Bacilli bacterium]|nr:DUF4160 domain-containing protein [Bacilli bacterium]